MNLLFFLFAWCTANAGTLSVEVLDVGQGDSILLQTPAGKTVLIDGGTGRRNVPQMLAQRDISSIDLMINTHAHADHLGGLDEVLEAMPVGVYIDSGMPHTTEAYSKVIGLVDSLDIRYKAVRAGQSFRFDDGIVITVISPYDPLLGGTRSDLNSNSVITRIDHRDICFLMMGDAELETERLVIEHGLKTCEVLKVAHHGSAHSSSRQFLELVDPEWAAISAGRRNRYKHPAPETIRRLEKAGAKVLRTDLHGRILFESNGRRVKVSVAVKPPEQPLPEGVTHKPVRTGTTATVQARPKVGAPSTPIEGAVASGPEVVGSVSSGRAEFAATVQSVSDAKSQPARGAAGKFDINTASNAQLIAVPGIGPARADAIVQYRNTHGPFASIVAVDDVPGIGAAIVKQLQQHAVVK
jgi:competence ComEA-like helix-hairpin-helix protein